MAERKKNRQPETVSEIRAKHRDPTARRTRGKRRGPARRVEQEGATRPLLENRDLGLEEGNDFA
jgi:hypothetical protein